MYFLFPYNMYCSVLIGCYIKIEEVNRHLITDCDSVHLCDHLSQSPMGGCFGVSLYKECCLSNASFWRRPVCRNVNIILKPGWEPCILTVCGLYFLLHIPLFVQHLLSDGCASFYCFSSGSSFTHKYFPLSLFTLPKTHLLNPFKHWNTERQSVATLKSRLTCMFIFARIC